MEFRNHIGFALRIDCKENYEKYVETMVLAGFTRIYPFNEMRNMYILWKTELINGERYVKICITDSALFNSQYEFTQIENMWTPTPFAIKG